MKLDPFVPLLFFISAVSISAQTTTTSKYPDPPVSLAELVKARYCPQEGVAGLNASLKADPKNTGLLLKRAVCFKYEKDPAYLDDVSAILALNPVLPKDFKESDNFLMNFNTPEETQKSLDFLVSANPNHSFPYEVRFVFKHEQKDFEGAIADAVKVIELDQTLKIDFNRRLSLILGKLSADPKVFAFYEMIFNTTRKKQQELSTKLKNFSPDSEQYKQIRQDIENTGSLISSISFNWARTAIKHNDSQIETAALEKMMQNEVRFQAYQMRSFYYQLKGISDKAFSDEVNYLLLYAEWLKVTLKNLNAEKDQAIVKNIIGNSYSRLGELYFKNQQYVKAIDSFEKAKQYSTSNNYLDYRIKAALQRLNGTSEPANTNLRPSNQYSPPRQNP